MKLLLLRLEGPMQSWGERGKWDAVRDSALFPTKSGVMGLLGACLGIERGSSELVALSQALEMGVRVERKGTLRWDFHTVQGYPLHTADGGKRSPSASTIVTRRAHLEDASFLVVLSGDDAWLDRCATALASPIWSPFLGRKSCPPTRPILDCLTDAYTSPLDALNTHPPIQRADERVQIQLETRTGKHERLDELVDNECRHFRRRNVSQEWR